MQKYKLSVLLFSIVFSPAIFAGYFSSLKYFGGFGAGYQHIDYQPGYGADFSPNNTIDYEFYFGAQSLHNFGFEFGLNFTPETSKYTTLYGGDLYPGTTVPLAPGTWELWEPTFKTEMIYAGINRYFALNQKKNFRVFGLLGLGLTFVESTIKFLDDDIPGAPSQTTIDSRLRTFKAIRTIPMFKVGFEYDFSNQVGARLAYAWKNYAAFDSMKSEERPYSMAELRLKNSNAVYLSIYATF